MNDFPLFKKWEKELEARKALGLFRELKNLQLPTDFASNDYLGLAKNKELQTNIEKRFQEATLSNKLGSTGSRLISGNNTYLEETEEYLASIHETESALLFSNGYMANLAVFSSIPQKGDTILYDELSHASIKDGIRMSLADRFPFLHNDLQSLENKLKKGKGHVFVAVESVYSMDGDFSPLKEMVALCEKYQALLLVDEAHSSGIFGKNGSGLVTSLGLEEQIPIRIHTFGKALGGHGAAVVGPKLSRNFLINFARPFIYTTATSLHNVLSIQEAYRFISNHPSLQGELQQRIKLFASSLPIGIDRVESRSSIQALLFSGNERVKNIASFFQSQGFDVRPILSPTVKKGSERLRVCLHTYNTVEEINTFCSLLKEVSANY